MLPEVMLLYSERIHPACCMQHPQGKHTGQKHILFLAWEKPRDTAARYGMLVIRVHILLWEPRMRRARAEHVQDAGHELVRPRHGPFENRIRVRLALVDLDLGGHSSITEDAEEVTCLLPWHCLVRGAVNEQRRGHACERVGGPCRHQIGDAPMRRENLGIGNKAPEDVAVKAAVVKNVHEGPKVVRPRHAHPLADLGECPRGRAARGRRRTETLVGVVRPTRLALGHLRHEEGHEVRSGRLAHQGHIAHVSSKVIHVIKHPCNRCLHVLDHVRDTRLRKVAIIRTDAHHTVLLQDFGLQEWPDFVANDPCAARDEDYNGLALCHRAHGWEVDIELMADARPVDDILLHVSVAEVGHKLRQEDGERECHKQN
mmetsp:Transcript_23164/g.62816  ORF Transcript_23164/g.62816 Transcript_23164/m.62816 type:complete len:372 (+) Transcript_23164:347-1462(+)